MYKLLGFFNDGVKKVNVVGGGGWGWCCQLQCENLKEGLLGAAVLEVRAAHGASQTHCCSEMQCLCGAGEPQGGTWSCFVVCAVL